MKFRRVIHWLSMLQLALIVANAILGSSAQKTQALGCSILRNTQYEAHKHGCRSQVIRTDTCGGRCHTHQVPRLEQPFIDSDHKLCSYSRVEWKSIQLNDCDPGVNRTFSYMNARACQCRYCNRAYTNCLGI